MTTLDYFTIKQRMVDNQYADNIFQMFTRLHAKDEYSGNGIGLSIVKKIAENHQGMVEAHSVPGKAQRLKYSFLPTKTLSILPGH
jgi:light-regulated signal transduction histidine kinase (bacteriophytochrome)